jgi:hypothetical protein
MKPIECKKQSIKISYKDRLKNMNADEVIKLINLGETSTVQFKERIPHIDPGQFDRFLYRKYQLSLVTYRKKKRILSNHLKIWI